MLSFPLFLLLNVTDTVSRGQSETNANILVQEVSLLCDQPKATAFDKDLLSMYALMLVTYILDDPVVCRLA